jgi:DNA-binding response OmpR family regulator
VHLTEPATDEEVAVSTVLVVEDEQKLREVLRSYLEHAGLTVLTASTGAAALSLVSSAAPDLLVLDLGLPDIPGEEVAREVRSKGQTPIVMLTAKAGEDDRIHGLELGADDYLTKPFSPRELVLRVEAILRRSTGRPRDEVLSFESGALVIDHAQRAVRVDDIEVELTPTEWSVLEALATSPGRVYSRAELINRVRGYEFEGYERTIDTHVKNLRRKIEIDPRQPRRVVTVLGAGYRLALTRDG